MKEQPFSLRIPNTFLPLLLTFLLFLSAGNLGAQMNIIVRVTQVTTNIGDCDGFIAGNSDPAWWWTGPGAINDQCFETTCNGCTVGTIQELFNENYVCIADVPATTPTVTFRACEDDGAGCALGAFIGICDGAAGSRNDNFALPTIPGTYAFGPLCVNSNCGAGGTQYCYSGQIVVAGSFSSPPANDDMCNSVLITVGAAPINGDNTCATVQAGEPDPTAIDNVCLTGISPSNTVWYRFVAPVSGHVIVSTDHGGTTFDTELAVYEATGATCPGNNFGTLTEIGGDDDAICLFDLDSYLDIECLTPGATYYIQMDGNDATDFGGFQLSVTSVGPPIATNNDICNALALGIVPFGGNITSVGHNNICADTEAGEVNPGFGIDGIQQTVWFTFTTDANVGYEMLIQGINNGVDNIDLQLALYSFSGATCPGPNFGTLTEIDSDYDILFFDEDLTVKCLEPNTTYYLQVDGSILPFLTEGDFDISITDDGILRAPNNDICSATNLGTIPTAGSVFLANQNNYCADTEVGEPTPLSWNILVPGIEQTVWYEFIPPACGSIEIELISLGADNIDLQVAVWESNDTTCSGTLYEVDSYDDDFSNSIDGVNRLRINCLDTAKTYWIQIDGGDWPLLTLLEGQFSLEVFDRGICPAPNDSICDAIMMGVPPLAPGVTLLNQHNFCSDNINEPFPSCFGTNMTVWYQIIAPPSGRITIDTDSDVLGTGDYIDLQLAIYAADGDTCGGLLTEVGCDYNDLLEFPPLTRDEELYVTCLIPGKPYWIMVDGGDDPDDVDGFFDITIWEEPGPPPITNDDKCDAIPMGVVPPAGSVNIPDAHNFCATLEAGEFDPANFGLDQTVWFTFVAPPSGNVTVSATTDPLGYGDDIDLQLAVYASSNGLCTGTFTEVNSDYDPVFFDEDLTVTCLTPGETYWVQVDGALWPWPLDVLVEGFFDLTVSEDPAFPSIGPNDDICNAVDFGVIPPGGFTPVTPGSNFCATEEAGEPNVSGGGNFFDCMNDETVWYKFTTSGTPGTITIEVTNTVTILANINVYTVPNGATCAFADLDHIAAANQIPLFDISLDLPCPKPNTTYYIQLDGLDCIPLFPQDYGTFDIQVMDDGFVVPTPPNDSICNAIGLGVVPPGGSTVPMPGDNYCASVESGEPIVDQCNLITDFSCDETVWYTFTTSATPGLITVDINSTLDLDAWLAVYSVIPQVSCNFADLTEVDQNTENPLSLDASLDLPCLLPNTTYYVQVDGIDFSILGDDEGTFIITVTDDGNPNAYAPYDNICSAYDFGVVPAAGSPLISTNNFCATEEAGEPNVSGGVVITDNSYDETVWFKFTTSATPGLTTVAVTNTNGINANLNIYSVPNGATCAFADLTHITSEDDLFSDNVSVNLPCLPPNTTWYVQVDGFDDLLTDDKGTFDISIIDDGNANAYAPNDDLCNRQFLGVVPSGGATAIVAGNNFCAGEETGEPNVSGLLDITDVNYDETVWYSFTTSATPGTITANVFNTTGIFASIICYEANPGATCNFADLTFERSASTNIITGDASLELICLEPNTTYVLQIDGADLLGNYGTFDIQVTDDGVVTLPPVYNDICFAVPLGDPTAAPVQALNQNNNCADEEPGEPNVNGDDETVWFTFIAPASGRATIDINSLAYIDANFSIYYSPGGACVMGGLQQVGSNHDNLISFDVSHTENCLIPGETYYIQVDGGDFFGDMGNFDITVTNADPGFVGPPNDDCLGAIPLVVQPGACQESGLWDVFNYGDPSVSMNGPGVQFCGDNCGDTWYCFIMPPTGNVLIEGNDEYGFLGLNNSDLTIIAYTGPDCNTLSPVGCDQGGFGQDPGFTVTAPPGQKVWLQVFDDGGDAFNEDFGLCVSDRCGPDACLQATQMVAGVNYCFENAGATGETFPTPGYKECGDGTDPEYSVYFAWETVCPYFQVTIEAEIGGICLFGEPEDGLAFALYQDSTPCDWNFQQLTDCQITDICVGNTWFFSKIYGPYPPGTQFIIQLDAIDNNIPLVDPGDDNGFIRIDESCVLPVNLFEFDGWYEPQANVLDWTSTSGLNVEYYVVERSFNARDFNSIGSVQKGDFVGGAQGGTAPGSETDFNYRFNDEAPVFGHNFYRLSMVDAYGNITHSEVVDIFVPEEDVTQLISIYPNPANKTVNLDLFAGHTGDYRIELTDMYGKILTNEKQNLESGNNTITLNLDHYALGMYLITVQDLKNNTKLHGKFIKQ